jgi:drug/metabolite transporter (DMT)-like permease
MRFFDRLRPYLGPLMVVFAASLWGLDGVVLRPQLYHLIAIVPVLVFLEHAIAFAFMLPFLLFELRELKKIPLRAWGSFLWIAIFGGAIGTMAITQALLLVRFEHLSVIVILQKLQPAFAIILAMLILKERPKKSFYGWAALAIMGSYLLTFGLKAPVFGTSLFTAAMFSLLAAFSFGSSTVFGKHALGSTNFRIATYLRFGLTTLLMGIIVLLTGMGFDAITSNDLRTLLIIAFSTGGVAIFIYYYGLRRVKAGSASIYELAFPVSTVMLDYLLHGNMLSAAQLFGASMLIVSMIMVTRLHKA